MYVNAMPFPFSLRSAWTEHNPVIVPQTFYAINPTMPSHFNFRSWLLAALLPALLALPLHSNASGGSRDHDRARTALQAGEILPLPTIMARVAQSHPGHVLEVELEREDERWIYELKLLQPSGGLLKLEIDAKSGAVLRQKTKGNDARSGR
jgi:uncharacterized membrane protein YkoI